MKLLLAMGCGRWLIEARVTVSDLVRAHTEMVFDRATRDLQTGPNQALGGKFGAQLAGSEQQRANFARSQS